MIDQPGYRHIYWRLSKTPVLPENLNPCVTRKFEPLYLEETQIFFFRFIILFEYLQVAEDDMKFDDMILEAAKSIANATASLIKAASEAQKELVAQGKVQKKTHIGSEDGQWSEGLVSAARLVAAATHNLCEAANSLVQGNASEEKLIAAAKQVSAATAQLLVACKVKADADSVAMRRLEKASNAVRRATDELVKAAQGAIDRNEEENEMTMNTTAGSVNIIAEEVEARETVYKMEKQLREAHKRLQNCRIAKYKGRGTDSETDQSG